MIKKLVDAVVGGVGHTAGKLLFDQALERMKDQLREPTEQERLDQEAKERDEAAREARAREDEAKRVAEERRKAVARTHAEIDAELEALKKKIRSK
jgi:hypothetical protein